MKQFIVAGFIFAVALVFLVRHFYRIFSGKGSACSCGTHKYTVKAGKLVKSSENFCCNCCKNCGVEQVD